MRRIGLILIGISIIIVGLLWFAILASSHNIPMSSRMGPGYLLILLIVCFIVLIIKRKK